MILITGSSGHLSALIIDKATVAGLAPIAAGRNPGPIGASQRRMDFDDPASLDFSGVQTLLLVSAGYAEDDVVMARHDNVIAAAERQGVGHIVYTSLTGAGDHLGFALAHRWTERRLQRSPLAWTILRNGLYAELVGALAAPIDGIISAPFGVAPIAAVAREDLADAALSVLRAPHHHIGAIYDLSGTTAWSVPELAHALDVAYAPVSLAQQRAILAASGMLPFQPAMLMSIYSAAAGGFLAAPASDLDSLLSTAPRDSFALAMAAAKPR